MSTRRLTTFAAALSAALVGVATPALAQTEASGFALGRFQPSPSGGRWFALDSLDSAGHLEPAASLLLDWGYKPLVIYDPDGNERSALVENQAIVHLGASLALWDIARLSLDLPFAAWQNGEDGQLGSTVYRAPSSASLGDLRIGADVRVGGRPGDPVRLAVGLQAFAPTGSSSQYLGDGKVRLSPRVLLAGDAGPWTWAAELGFDYRALSNDYDGAPLGSQLRIGAAAGYQALDGQLIVGPEIYGSTGASGFLERRTTALEGLLGARYRVGGGVMLGLGVGTGLSRALGTPRARGVFSLAWAPTATPQPPSDRDGDGIRDASDACPDEPGPASADASRNGCPPPPDRDRDGVADAGDLCPDDPAGPRPDPKRAGCPLPPDRDGDGFADADDRCPDEPGVASNDPSRKGCPPDADGDGVADARDACPEVPGVASNEPSLNGCPPDADRDGVVDAKDLCPTEPAGARPDPQRTGCPFRDADDDGLADWTDNCPNEKGPASNQGCPVKKKQLVVITREKLEIKEKVFFASGKSRILPKSYNLLDQVVTVLQGHPEIAHVIVEGHTDDRGRAEYNRKLSAARAEAVRDYLVKKGVKAERLESRGFGPDRPADTNRTAAGRERNRRVEFTIPGPAQEVRAIEVETELAPLAPLAPAKSTPGDTKPAPATEPPKALPVPATRGEAPQLAPLTPAKPKAETKPDLAPLAPLAPKKAEKVPASGDAAPLAPLTPKAKKTKAAADEAAPLAPLAPLVPGGSR